MNMSFTRQVLLFSLFLSLLNSSSFAKTSTNTLQSNATLAGLCFFSASSINFGEWLPNSPSAAASGVSQLSTGTITVLCSNKLAYTIKGPPLETRGIATGHFMQAAGSDDELEYNIWLSSNYNSNWFSDGGTYSYGGNHSSGTNYISANGTGNNVSHTLYVGLYPKGVYPGYIATPGNYNDTITLNLSF